MAISMKHVKYILLGTFGHMGIAFSYGYTMEKDLKTLMPRYVCVWVPGRTEFGRPPKMAFPLQRASFKFAILGKLAGEGSLKQNI